MVFHARHGIVCFCGAKISTLVGLKSKIVIGLFVCLRRLQRQARQFAWAPNANTWLCLSNQKVNARGHILYITSCPVQSNFELGKPVVSQTKPRHQNRWRFLSRLNSQSTCFGSNVLAVWQCSTIQETTQATLIQSTPRRK